MSRVLALVGAILLIVLAVLVRAAIDDGDDDGNGDNDDGDGDELVVHCIPELADTCEAIDRPMALTIVEPRFTIEAIQSGEDIDAWVTLDPWPQMAALQADDRLFDGQVGVAVDALTLVVRSASLTGDCGSTPTVACIQVVDPDHPVFLEPETALGLLTVGAAASDVFLAYTGDASFARQDLESGSEAALAIDEFVFAADPLEDMFLFAPAGPQATIDTGQRAGTRIDGSREEGNLALHPLAVPTSVAVVVSGPQADRITGEPSFTDALESSGWRLAADAVTTGLPSAGVLVALGDFVG